MTPGPHLAKLKPTGGIEITDWKPYEKNTLKGFFDATLPSGLVFRGLMLHEREDERWVSFPSKEWVNAKGEKQFTRWVEFSDRAASDKFQAAVLAALDRYFESAA